MLDDFSSQALPDYTLSQVLTARLSSKRLKHTRTLHTETCCHSLAVHSHIYHSFHYLCSSGAWNEQWDLNLVFGKDKVNDTAWTWFEIHIKCKSMSDVWNLARHRVKRYLTWQPVNSCDDLSGWIYLRIEHGWNGAQELFIFCTELKKKKKLKKALSLYTHFR